MLTKTLKKMEVTHGFIQIPSKNKAELMGSETAPFDTKLNDSPAKVDKYGRLWSEYIKNKFSVNTEVTLSRNESGFQVTFNGQKQETAVSEKAILESVINGKRILYNRQYREDYDVVIGFNDALEFLNKVPENTATLVVTSPPYNIGKAYEERVELKEYLNWQEQIVKRCVEILKPQGSICWEIGNYVEEKEVFPLDTFFYHIFKKLGLKLRNRIVWHFEHGLHASLRFSGRYETILWFTKSDNYVFNLDSVRIPQKYKGKRAYKGKNKGKPTCNALGKNPSDIWPILLEDWEKEIWDIPNVKSNHPEKTVHPSQFPIELVERLVLSLTNENDTVLDPFLGVGSSIIAAVLNNRKGIGVDKEKAYTDLAYERVVSAINGTLKKRPLGKPIWIPHGNEKVVRPPEEWQVKGLSEFVK